MTDFGQDVSCLNDLDPSLSLVNGTQLLGQDLLHRLTTARGSLQYDLDYGYDTRTLLNASITPQFLTASQGYIQAECLKDQRVQQCAAALVFTFNNSRLTIAINITTAAGPFALVLSVSAVTAQLISFQPAN